MVEIPQPLQDLGLVPEYLHSPQKSLTVIPFVSIVSYSMQDEERLWLHLSHTLISSEATVITLTSSPEACFSQASAPPHTPNLSTLGVPKQSKEKSPYSQLA